MRVHTARAGGAPGIDLDQRSSWHVEDCRERGAVGPHSFGRPAEAERPAAGDTGRPHGLRTPAPVASNWVAKSGRPALMCTSCGVGDWCGGGAGGESIIGVVGHRGRRHCRRPTVAGIRIYQNRRNRLGSWSGGKIVCWNSLSECSSDVSAARTLGSLGLTPGLVLAWSAPARDLRAPGLLSMAPTVLGMFGLQKGEREQQIKHLP